MASRYRVERTDERGIKRLQAAVAAYPPAFRGNRLNLLFLDNAAPVPSADEYLRDLDGMLLREERCEYLVGNRDNWPFPTIDIARRPDPGQLSGALFERFDVAPQLAPTQRDIGRIVADIAVTDEADVVALIVVDGLSSYDLPDRSTTIPCLVDGVSTTEFGYREAIGRPPVSQQLFSLGYRHQLGLTYYDRDANPLAGDLHTLFGKSQVQQIATFAEGLRRIRQVRIARGHIQISAPGLDGLSHFHRDVAPRAQYLRRIMRNFSALVDCLKESAERVVACLTADHGILWREVIEANAEVPADLLPDDARHPRYVNGALMRPYARTSSFGGRSYSLLRLPFLTRPLRATEWGVHGRISAWESAVPMIIRRTAIERERDPGDE